MLIVQTTVDKRSDAERLALALVRGKIAACASYFPASSAYFWGGRLHKGREFVLELKIRKRDWHLARRAIERLHPHSLPQIIAFEPFSANAAYRRWVEKGV